MDMTLATLIGGAVLLISYSWSELMALWRTWLGAEGTGPRFIKITVLALFMGGMFHMVAPYNLWDARLWIVLNVLHVAAVCLWFVTSHPNGGGNGAEAVKRYGFAGLGYPLAYPARNQIPAIKILGWHLIKAKEWTRIGELWLGFVTGRAVGLLYVLAAIAKALTQTSV